MEHEETLMITCTITERIDTPMYSEDFTPVKDEPNRIRGTYVGMFDAKTICDALNVHLHGSADGNRIICGSSFALRFLKVYQVRDLGNGTFEAYETFR